MRFVLAHHVRRIAFLVAQHHFDAAIGALNHVIVGQHVAGLVEDEARALALLRHRAIEEVEHQRRRSDVHHRRQHPLVDGNVVLLVGVVGGRGLGLGQVQRRARAVRAGDSDSGLQIALAAQCDGGQMRREEPEPACEHETRITKRNVRSFMAFKPQIPSSDGQYSVTYLTMTDNSKADTDIR